MIEKILIPDGRANIFSFSFTVDNVTLDPRNFTKIEIKGGLVDIDVLTLVASTYEVLADRLNIKLGLLSLPLGIHYVTMYVYDAVDPAGIDFGELIIEITA